MNPREFCRLTGYSTALFLTYDFDAVFFERVVLRELWAGGTGDVLVVADSSRIDASLGRWDSGLIHLGRRYQLVRAAVNGAFHPKVIFRAGSSGAVAWIGTGNLTFGGWGGNREMSTAWHIGGSDATWVQDLMEQLDVWCPGTADHDVPERLRRLPSIESALASTATGAGPVVLSRAGDSLSSQIARRWVGRRFAEAKILTGSTDRDAAFLRWLHDSFGVERASVVVDPGNSSFDPASLAKLHVKVKTLEAGGPTPLHAKVCWLSGPDGSAAIMGSANCSWSAWLRDPAVDGNIEAVAIYEPAPQKLVDEISGLFDEGKAFVSLPPETDKPESHAPKVPYPVSEVTWDSRDCKLRIRFSRDVPITSKVTVKIDGEVAECRPLRSTSATWSATLSLQQSVRTRFTTVTTASETGSEPEVQRHWVNSREDLIHAAHGRQIEDVINGLRRQAIPEEQQRMVRELHRIGAVLLSEPETFPDPVVASGSRQENGKTEPDDEVKPVDPATLIRSLTDIPGKRGADYSGSPVGVSLFGVMRALFPEDFEGPVGDTVIDESPPKGKQAPRRTRQRAISGPVRNRLRAQMEKFIDEFRGSSFGEKCSARQFIQAAAYPLAVGMIGAQGGWVSNDDAVSWARLVFDTLFQRVSPREPGYIGVLQFVEARFRREGKQEVFREVVGDGTLWLTLLCSLGGVWNGERAAFERALALRSVRGATALIGSTDNTRIAELLPKMREGAEVLVARALEYTEKLDSLEEALQSQWQELLSSQQAEELVHEPEDLLWSPNAGWAIAQESAAMKLGEKMDIYLKLRAKIVRVMASGYYVNVTKVHELHKMIDALVASETD